MKLTRRNLLIGAGASLLAAPAIVQACNIMPVRNRGAWGVWWGPERIHVIRVTDAGSGYLEHPEVSFSLDEDTIDYLRHVNEMQRWQERKAMENLRT